MTGRELEHWSDETARGGGGDDVRPRDFPVASKEINYSLSNLQLKRQANVGVLTLKKSKLEPVYFV
jgi:hypothetical protein